MYQKTIDSFYRRVSFRLAGTDYAKTVHSYLEDKGINHLTRVSNPPNVPELFSKEILEFTLKNGKRKQLATKKS